MPETTTEIGAVLDATGLSYPMPVLKALSAPKVRRRQGGDRGSVTGPETVKAFEHPCETTGCELLEASGLWSGVLRFGLKKPI